MTDPAPADLRNDDTSEPTREPSHAGIAGGVVAALIGIAAALITGATEKQAVLPILAFAMLGFAGVYLYYSAQWRAYFQRRALADLAARQDTVDL